MKYNLCHLNILLWFSLIVSNCLSQKARLRKRALSKEVRSFIDWERKTSI
jgi:hypothetical protein